MPSLPFISISQSDPLHVFRIGLANPLQSMGLNHVAASWSFPGMYAKAQESKP